MCANFGSEAIDLKTVGGIQNDGATKARAPLGNGHVRHVTIAEQAGSGGEDTVVKKRKTRRGKSKRRNHPNPYSKVAWQQQRKNMNNKQLQFNRKFRANLLQHGQALAPFNSNQFLMEDHGELQELDDKLNKSDGAAAGAGASTSTLPPRTRDSSFSVDSDGDFYSSPEDEEEFLTKEFDHAYEDLHAERLQSMSKDQLIVDFIQMEARFEVMKKQQENKTTDEATNTREEIELQQQVNKLLLENDELRRENEILRSGLCRTASSLSSTMDSESDSSSSTCHSSTATSNSRECEMKDTVNNTAATRTPVSSPAHVNYAEINGFSPHQTSPTSV